MGTDDSNTAQDFHQLKWSSAQFVQLYTPYRIDPIMGKV